MVQFFDRTKILWPGAVNGWDAVKGLQLLNFLIFHIDFQGMAIAFIINEDNEAYDYQHCSY